MTGDRSRLRNFTKKFIRTVRFGNDNFGAIMGYGDYVIADSVISSVYYVEGLGHNLFSVGQFCDSDLEVAFRKHTFYVRDTDGVELIKGSRGSNFYTILVKDMMKSSPIYLLSKASKNQSWLWNRRLNHLNFGTINDLARKDLRRVFWGADEEISDGGIPRVIVLGYDGLPMQPVVPDLIDMVDSYILKAWRYPTDHRQFSKSRMSVTDYDEDEVDEDEEKHLAPADSAVVVPANEPEAPARGYGPTHPTHSSPPHVPSPVLPSSGCPNPNPDTQDRHPLHSLIDCSYDRIYHSSHIPPTYTPLYTATPHAIGESSTARPTRGRGVDYGFVSTVDAEARRQGTSEVGYGIRDTWVDPAEAVPEIATL
ncbi:hypothetical protein Tco_1144250 [Tanacetum coccineum]